MFHGLPSFLFSEVSVRDHQMCSLREELRAAKAVRWAHSKHGKATDTSDCRAFDFQSHARLEIEVKVKFAELAGRCKRDGALAANGVRREWNQTDGQACWNPQFGPPERD